MKIYLATDHAGFEFKQNLKSYLLEKGYDVEDCGAFELDPNDDYPDFIAPAVRKVAQNLGSFGIVLGKSGAGECIVANKIKGIRAVLGVSEQNVRLSREHNDANVLSLGSEIVDEQTAKQLVEIFLNTPFSNEERHVRRLEKISVLEKNTLA